MPPGPSVLARRRNSRDRPCLCLIVIGPPKAAIKTLCLYFTGCQLGLKRFQESYPCGGVIGVASKQIWKEQGQGEPQEGETAEGGREVHGVSVADVEVDDQRGVVGDSASEGEHPPEPALALADAP